MAEMEQPKNGNLRIPWSVLMWLLGIAFLAGVQLTIWGERTYVDNKIGSLNEVLTGIRVDQAKILQRLESIEEQKGRR